MKMHMRRVAFGGSLLLPSLFVVAPLHADLTHRYSFTTDASDSVGAANGTLENSATVSGGQLQLNNPNFSPGGGNLTYHNPAIADPNGYLSLPASILPSSGSATIEEWFTFTGSGFYTESYTFDNSNNDANPPTGAGGEYLMHTISAPQPLAQQPSNTGGNHIAQTLNGYAGPGPTETDAYGTTPGQGFAGGGYLDDGSTYMSATVIDATTDTLSYYLYDESLGGIGGLQSVITAIPLSSYSFTNAYLGRSAFNADNATSGSIDEFRIYNNAQSAVAVAADYLAGPNVVLPVPEPVSLSVIAVGALGLMSRRRSNRSKI